MANGVYGHYLDNKAWNATVTADATPLTNYANQTLVSAIPSARVRYGTGTVTVTLTFGSAVTADVMALPVSNLQGSVLALTNGAGLNEAITLPTLPANRIPKTAIKEFASSSSTVWNLVITGNTEDVILGGGFWLGAKRTLDRNFRYGWREIEEQPGEEQMNDYGVEYVPFYETQIRRVVCDFKLSATGVDQMKAWHQDGRKRPSLFWPDRTINDAYIGRWASGLEMAREFPTFAPLTMTFAELCKGKPV